MIKSWQSNRLRWIITHNPKSSKGKIKASALQLKVQLLKILKWQRLTLGKMRANVVPYLPFKIHFFNQNLADYHKEEFVEENITLSGKEPGNTSYRWQPSLFQTLFVLQSIWEQDEVMELYLGLGWPHLREITLHLLSLKDFQNRVIENDDDIVSPIYIWSKLL